MFKLLGKIFQKLESSKLTFDCEDGLALQYTDKLEDL